MKLAVVPGILQDIAMEKPLFDEPKAGNPKVFGIATKNMSDGSVGFCCFVKSMWTYLEIENM